MTEAIEALLSETRRFPPPAEFAARARISSPEIYAEAEADFRAFWHGHALREITWFKEPAEVLDDSNPPFYKWFADGELNVSYNCLDRHIQNGGGDKTALIWIGEPGEERHITYPELRDEVAQCANALKALGVERGDRVAIYMRHGAGAADRDARVRAHRRGALGRVRRFLVDGARRPHRGRGVQGA